MSTPTRRRLETDTYGINNAGVIVGDYVDSKGVQHGMILAGSKLTTVDNKAAARLLRAPAGIAFYGVNSARRGSRLVHQRKDRAGHGLRLLLREIHRQSISRNPMEPRLPASTTRVGSQASTWIPATSSMAS